MSIFSQRPRYIQGAGVIRAPQLLGARGPPGDFFSSFLAAAVTGSLMIHIRQTMGAGSSIIVHHHPRSTASCQTVALGMIRGIKPRRPDDDSTD